MEEMDIWDEDSKMIKQKILKQKKTPNPGLIFYIFTLQAIF